MYNQSETEFDSDFRAYLESNFKRYLDDCFMIFTRTEQELEKFHKSLTTLHPRIKLTIDKNRTCLPFLDTLIIITMDNSNQISFINLPIQNNTFFILRVTPNVQETAYHTIWRED